MEVGVRPHRREGKAGEQGKEERRAVARGSTGISAEQVRQKGTHEAQAALRYRSEWAHERAEACLFLSVQS